jgi:hypothetical protein
MVHRNSIVLSVVFSTATALHTLAFGTEAPKPTIIVNWEHTVLVSKTVPTLQVVVSPLLRPGSAIHDPVFKELRALGATNVRYAAWFPYPRLSVAELEPPSNGNATWDFSLMDPIVLDFLDATSGHDPVLNFCTIPQWMFQTTNKVPYPDDPKQVAWDYTQGTELRDPSLKELAGYYARVFSWYAFGGFEDENGKRHDSGHHFKIPYWEVLNEPDYEHDTTPQQYTERYDAIVGAIHKISPATKFVGVSFASPSQHPEMFEYFLDPKNHRPGIPLDYISYHFYAVPSSDQSPEVQQFTFFEQAEGFLNTVRYIEAIRKRLSPGTGTMLNEVGSISADDLAQGESGHVAAPIPNSYWNLSGALYAYLYAQFAAMEIDVAGESQMVGYPTQFPSVSMVDWSTGQPNARFWVLKLLHDHFGPGDKLVETSSSNPYVFAQGFISPDGRRQILLVNKRDRSAAVSIGNAESAKIEYVDESTGFQPPSVATIENGVLELRDFSVAVVMLH